MGSVCCPTPTPTPHPPTPPPPRTPSSRLTSDRLRFQSVFLALGRELGCILVLALCTTKVTGDEISKKTEHWGRE